MPKQNLVPKWLETIGLSHVVQNFEDAGMISPNDLAELEVNHYSALGVKEPGDRKKLFYLVQRVKMEVKGDKSGKNPSPMGSESNDHFHESFHSPDKSFAGDTFGNVNDSNDSLNVLNQNEENCNENEANNDDYRPLLSPSPEVSMSSSSEGDVPLPPDLSFSSNSPKISLANTNDSNISSSSSFRVSSPFQNSQKRQSTRLQNLITKSVSRKGDDSQFQEGIDREKSAKSKKNETAMGNLIKPERPEFSSRKDMKSASNYRVSQNSEQNITEDDYFAGNFSGMEISMATHVQPESLMTLKSSHKHDISDDIEHSRNRTKMSVTSGTRKSRRLKEKKKTLQLHQELLHDDDDQDSTFNRSVKSSTSASSKKVKDKHNLEHSKSKDRGKRTKSAQLSTSSRRKSILSRKMHSDSELFIEQQESTEDNTFSNQLSLPTVISSSGSSITSKSLKSSSRERRSRIPNPTVSSGQHTRSKRLSTIPSDRTLPMSPLINMKTTDTMRSSNKLQEFDSDLESNSSSSSKSSRNRKEKSSRSTFSSDYIKQNVKVGNKIELEKEHNNAETKLSNPRNRHRHCSDVDVSDDLNDTLQTNESKSTNHVYNKPRDITPRKQRPKSKKIQNKNETFSSSNIDISARLNLPETSHHESKKSRATSSIKTSKLSPRKARIKTNISPSRKNNYQKVENSLTLVESSLSASRKSSSIASSAPIFVHGMPQGDSWLSRIKSLRESNDLSHLQNMRDKDMSDVIQEMRIRVIVKKRPISKKEAAKSDDIDVIHPLQYNSHGRVLVYQPKTRVDLTKEIETIPFAFDNVYNEKSTNAEIYQKTIKHLIPGFFEGRWASVFAYGQTGSGKTFTMMGSNMTGIRLGDKSVENHSQNAGLYFLAAQDIFYFSKQSAYSHLTVGASLFEIYGGKFFDLLNNRNPVKCLENHKGKVCFPGLSEHPVSDENDLISLIENGATNRSTGTTSANADSSRSHAVLHLSLRKESTSEYSRFTFIDLAGSERGADTNKASKTTRMEGAEINTSLLALKEVIRALATGDSLAHIPFRGSKLTQVLKESFVGKNSRSVMVACVAPNMINCEHTLNTLRYADRVKERNPESGQLTENVATATVIQKKQPYIRPLTAPPAGSDLEINSRPTLTSGTKHQVEYEGKVADYSEILITDSDDGFGENLLSFDHYDQKELDDVLLPSSEPNQDERSSYRDLMNYDSDEIEGKHVQEGAKQIGHSNKILSTDSKQEAATPLIKTHRSIMTKMLAMVKKEMTLVNYTDANRDLVDDYLLELDDLQAKQLSMISSLRNALVDYYAARPHGLDMKSESEINSMVSDGTFDDLRSL